MMHLFQYDADTVAQLISGELIRKSDEPYLIQFLINDSRKVSSPETSLFFALKGRNNDGHFYLEELYDSGVRNFVVSEATSVPAGWEHVNVILVKDTLTALQDLAASHRRLFKYPVLGITGSNGKTVVKEWIYQLLREKKNIVRSPKSYNSQIGVPLSVWLMGAEHELGVFEAGISKPGEMHRLQEILLPDYGIFTNIGEAHDENFSSMNEKIKEKLSLFKGVSKLIYCKDYKLLDQLTHESEELKQVEKISWSKRSNAGIIVSKVEKHGEDTALQIIHKNRFLSAQIPFIDDASIENAIHCWVFLLELQVDPKDIAIALQQLSPVAMRLEMKEGINNCSIINDSYNSDLGSLGIALDFLIQQQQHVKKTVVLSDILQSGKDERLLYQQVAGLLKKKSVNRLIGVGESITRQQQLFEVPEKEFFPDMESFLKSFKLNKFKDETVLLKGARSFGFERISKLLQQKAHETVLEINLGALVHNLNHYRSLLRPDTKIMAMVKAFSYGSGSFEIASVLQFHRVDYLAVAYADEGVELRKAGITLPIMVMNPEVQSFDLLIRYQLEPEIYSFRILQQFVECLQQHELSAAHAIHIELDTGMHRLGFEKEDLNELIVRIKNHKNIVVRSIFSHFVGSDEHGLDYFSHKQIREFQDMSAQIMQHFDYPIIRHLSNSSGISRFSEAQFDMVRLGIGMYGVSSNEYEQKKLQTVSTLKTTISQIRSVKAMDTIGYSRRGVVERDSRIATIPIGYADGLSRRLSNGVGKVFIAGKLLPIVGNVCMDMCMIDVTDAAVAEGDEVIVFGEPLSINDLALASETIPYEILTSVSRRVKRVYYQD